MPQQGSSYIVHCCPSFWIRLFRLVYAHGKFSPLSGSNLCVGLDLVKFGLVMNEKHLKLHNRVQATLCTAVLAFGFVFLGQFTHTEIFPLSFSLSDSNSCVLVSVAQQVSKTTTSYCIVWPLQILISKVILNQREVGIISFGFD